MEKVFGTTERHDQLIVYSNRKSAKLIYGYGEENGQGYDWRHDFSHLPTKKEVLQVIVDSIDAHTDERILMGFKWEDNEGNECAVWLSEENQRNFSEAHRLAVLMGAKKFEEVTFKIGEDENRKAKYCTFSSLNELNNFYLAVFAHIKQCLADGWREKDAANEWITQLEL